MKRKAFSILLVVSGMFLTSGCGEDKKACAEAPKLMKSTVNPNGDSELALLMRALFDDAMKIKKAMQAGGEVLSPEVDYEEILTADATEPEKAASQEYQSMGKAYISLMKNFESAHDTSAHIQFNGVVDACMGCHRALCPGPMVKIRKLYLKQ